MPSPFPGMDPFLEDPAWFPDLHDCLIQLIKAQIQPQLPPTYHAVSRRRTWIEHVPHSIEPDVAIVEVSSPGRSEGTSSRTTETLTAPITIHAPRPLFVETYLEIYVISAGRRRKLVTSIEVLSPSNKSPRSPGRKQFRRKQADMLAGGVNLVELDLLHSGKHSTAVPLPQLREKVTASPYHTCTWRASHPDDYVVHPCHLTEALPTIAIPLSNHAADVQLDLQTAIDDAYRAGDYEKVVDYHTLPPPPPLSDTDAARVRERVQAWAAR